MVRCVVKVHDLVGYCHVLSLAVYLHGPWDHIGEAEGLDGGVVLHRVHGDVW